MGKYIKEGMMERARVLRKNATNAENRLWYFIRAKRLKGYKFKRQYILGPYIVDFICLEKRLIIELDGSQHIETVEYDKERTHFLNSKGYRVLRFWNNEVLNNIENVLNAILDPLVSLLSPLPNPPPRKRERGSELRSHHAQMHRLPQFSEKLFLHKP